MPERTECAKQTEDAKDAEDSRTLGLGHQDEGDVDERYEHEEAVHDVPTALEVGVFADQQALCQYLRSVQQQLQTHIEHLGLYSLHAGI